MSARGPDSAGPGERPPTPSSRGTTPGTSGPRESPTRRGHASGAPPIASEAGPGGRPSRESPARRDTPARRPSPASAEPGEDYEDDERDSLIDVPGGVRLQKVLAAAGVGSRRHCEELIGEGRVEVDGETVRRFGARVDPQHQIIRVDGMRIPSRQDLVYLALNKPAGVLTTMSDDRGRPTIADFLDDYPERLYHVGRLDYDTEGLMLLMNDGELAHRLAHPSYGVLKTYLADVPGPLPRDVGRRLLSGVELEDGVASADKFRVVEQAGSRALVELTLHEGRKHIVRRMLAEVGHPVSRLVRTHVGPIALGSQRPGTTRPLTTREIGELYAAVGL
jgi:23S rRNA pseudouridine2605 synthase